MGFIMLLLLVGFIAFVVVYLKGFNASKNERQEQAEENLKRNGGKRVLEWSLPVADGAADDEFEELITEIPSRIGESAKFYKLGFVMGNKRISYIDVKDILVEGAESGGLNKVRDSAKIWIYRHKGATIGINGLAYKIDGQTAQAIKQGLGF